jgi:hypothetical protein
LIIDRAGWLEEALQAMIDSDAAILARGCTHFGWKIRTEAMVINVAAWNRESIFQALFAPPKGQFAERIVESIVNEHFPGRQCIWPLLPPSRQERAAGIFFRATHQSSEYADLARSVGLSERRTRQSDGAVFVALSPKVSPSSPSPRRSRFIVRLEFGGSATIGSLKANLQTI